MRDFKFRAWDKMENKMYDNGIILHPSGAVKCFNSKKQVCKGMNHNEDLFVLMQYTGLKDKKGVEIYEGDVVTYGFKTKDFNDLVLHTGKIFFDEYMFLVDGDKVNEEWHSINRIRYVEVIGNIYSNPELLTS